MAGNKLTAARGGKRSAPYFTWFDSTRGRWNPRAAGGTAQRLDRVFTVEAATVEIVEIS
jgi:tRNA 2-selenouridine synthase SelU